MVAGDVVEGSGRIGMALAKQIAPDGKPLLGQFQGAFRLAEFVERIRQIVIQVGEKRPVSEALVLVLVERKLDVSLDFLRLPAVKRRVCLKPGEAARLVRRELQRVLMPFPQMVDLGLEPRQLQEILSQGAEPIGNSPAQLGRPGRPLCQRNFLATYLPHQPVNPIAASSRRLLKNAQCRA